MSEKTRDYDGLPAIKPAQDEVASYRRSGRSEAPRQSNFNGILVFVIVLMAIMMAIGGFTLWQVQTKLDQANQLLDKGQRDTHDLEQRLSQSGDTASKKFKEMDNQIRTNVSEIDKLWASAYRANKADIGSNSAAIAKIKKSTDEAQQQVAQLSSQMAKLSSDMDQVTATAIKMKQDVQNQTDDMTTQVSLVRGKMQDQSVTVEGNKRNVAILRKQVKDLQEDVHVINRYRQQVNQQLLQIQTQLQGGASKSSN